MYSQHRNNESLYVYLQDAQYHNQFGATRTIESNMCSVYLYKQGQEVDFPINAIQLVTPQKQDKVNVLNSKGYIL